MGRKLQIANITLRSLKTSRFLPAKVRAKIYGNRINLDRKSSKVNYIVFALKIML